jgi:TonB family protein
MKTQANSALAGTLTREAPPRQVGYGLPCAKCHKYFPADLEVCPICKGRERVSPIAPKRPVQSETSVMSPSTTVAPKPEAKESPRLETPLRTPPFEIKVRVNDQLLDQEKTVVTSATEEELRKELDTPASVEPITAQPQDLFDLGDSIAPPVIIEFPVVPETQVVATASVITPPVEAQSFEVSVVEARRVIESKPVTLPSSTEVHAGDPVCEEETYSLESEAAFVAPTQKMNQNECLDLLYPAEAAVTPALVDDETYESTPVSAEQKKTEPAQKVETAAVAQISSTPSEMKVIETNLAEAKTAINVLETKFATAKTQKKIAEKNIVEAVVANGEKHRITEEKPAATEQTASAQPSQPADVSAPIVVHLNLGELRPAKAAATLSEPVESRKSPSVDAREYGTSEKKLQEKETEAALSPNETLTDADLSQSSDPANNRKFDLVTFALGVVVLACAVLLITLASFRLMPHRTSGQLIRRAQAAYNAAPAADQNNNSAMPVSSAAITANSTSSAAPTVTPTAAAPTVAPSKSSAPPSTSLTPSAAPERILTLTPGLAEGNLLYRVEPDYPEDARRQGVQGAVVMNLHIGKDGAVQNVDLVSGPPLLAQASIAAVKQWRFRTRYVNGNEVAMQTQITLHFALPTP